MAAVVEREPQLWRRARVRLTESGAHRGKKSLYQLLRKKKVLNFMSSHNEQGLKPRVLKDSGLGWVRAWRA